MGSAVDLFIAFIVLTRAYFQKQKFKNKTATGDTVLVAPLQSWYYPKLVKDSETFTSTKFPRGLKVRSNIASDSSLLLVKARLNLFFVSMRVCWCRALTHPVDGQLELAVLPTPPTPLQTQFQSSFISSTTRSYLHLRAGFNNIPVPVWLHLSNRRC